MFFALDTLGTDNLHTIRTLPAQQKWGYVFRLAQEAGVSALLLTETLYDRTLSMPLETMPEPPEALRLLYSMDGLYTLLSDADADALRYGLDAVLQFAHALRVTDVYIPPPHLPGDMHPLRGFVHERFQEIIAEWMPKYRWAGVSLSVESLIQETIFQGMLDYAYFIQQTEHISALIHIAHLVYDGFSENELLELIAPLRVAGFRIGDADPALPRGEGIGLPVGMGTIGLRRFLAPYAGRDIPGILSIDAPFEMIRSSLERLERYVGMREN